MSLKGFHIFFIAVSVLLCFFFGYWALKNYFGNSIAGYLATAIGSFLTGVLLCIYGISFIRKTAV